MLLALVLPLGAIAETQITAISVGKGDAIVVTTGEHAYLIDTGKGYAMGRVKRALRMLEIERLDAVFLTHIDDDHAGGLEWLSQSGIEVGAWYASDFYFEEKPKNHPLTKLGLPVTWLRAGDVVPAGADAAFTVLAPLTLSEEEENDNSLILMLETPDGRALFTGDVEFPGEAPLLASGADLSSAILKVSNHGDGDATSAEFLARVNPEIAIISTDTREKADTPDLDVLWRLEAIGAKTYITQEASAVAARLADGHASAQYLYWDDARYDGISLSVDVEGDRVILKNAGNSEVPLEGFYLYSDKGNELFQFEHGLLPAGGTLVIGSKSADGAYDILWDEKNVISNKGGDVVTLYDADGTPIAYGS